MLLSFSAQEKAWVVIMDGEDEGVYAWITANYLLGTIKVSTPPDTPTDAVLDLGGDSTQIMFELVFASSDMQLEEREHQGNISMICSLVVGAMCSANAHIWGMA